MKEKIKGIGIAAVPAALAIALLLAVRSHEAGERALADYLMVNSEPGDVIVLVSSDFSKMDRLPGRRVIFSEVPYLSDIAGHGCAWIVGPEDLVVPLVGDVTVAEVGPYRVHRILIDATGDAGRGYDLLLALATAQVGRTEGGLVACPLRAGVFACQGDPWFSIQVTRLAMGGVPMECIFAHPKNGSDLVLSFPETPGGRRLRLEGGIGDDGVYYDRGTEVVVRVEAGGREVGRTSFENTPGIKEKVVTFDEPVAGPATLALRISSADQNTRHFCFRGWLEKD